MAIQKERYCTYDDWQALDENTRAELIDGRIYLMAAPTRRHQEISSAMFIQLANHVSGKNCKKCKVYFSPFAVRLERDVVVEPDIVVVCDPQKLTKAGMNGAPDLIIEILSPSTTSHDRVTKLLLYRRAGVPEYWIVDPEENTLTVHRLIGNQYTIDVYISTETATVAALPDFEMDLSAVFTEDDGF